jgi:hypothetical protein
MQQLWRERITWVEQIPDGFKKNWQNLQWQLPTINCTDIDGMAVRWGRMWNNRNAWFLWCEWSSPVVLKHFTSEPPWQEKIFSGSPCFLIEIRSW